jgi:hypothetical protein
MMSADSTNDLETTDPEQMPTSVAEISDLSQWHKTLTLADGTLIGRLGAYWYILDQNGCAMSDGYHEISCDENGGYNGTRSARTEPIVLYPKSD